MTATPGETIAELQRANAALQRERDAALAREAALADVLRVINHSPGDPAPVFEAILAKAHALCGAASGTLALFDGTHFTGVAMHGLHPDHAARMRRPFRPNPRQQSLIDGARFTYAEDPRAVDPRSPDDTAHFSAELTGTRSLLAVALRKGGVFLGFISANWTEIRPFSDTEAALLESFAAQAVIAIENTRLFTEQQEALERQTATSEVLQVINASPGDLAPVFDAMLEKAMRLCGAAFGMLRSYDGERLRTMATRGLPEALAEWSARSVLNAHGTMIGRVLASGRSEQILDLRQSEGYTSGTSPGIRAVADLGGARTILFVPLIKDRRAVGFFTVYRQEVRAFSDRQIALLESFAAQAVIAMENARLLGELRARTEELAARNSAFSEQVEHQSATIDVLKAMSASPGDAQPVFDLIVRRALEFCGARGARLVEFDGTHMHLRSIVRAGAIDPEAESALRARYPMRPAASSILGRAVLQGAMVRSKESRFDPAKLDGEPINSVLGLPLLRDGHVVGGIAISQPHGVGFTDAQVELLKTFAEQAVIAIGSVATWRALRERTAELADRNRAFAEQIKHQAATIDVLKVMSASTNDTRPVFDIILRRAMELCNCMFGSVYEYDGEQTHVRAIQGFAADTLAAFEREFPSPLRRANLSDRAILEKRTVHIRDVDAEPERLQAARDLGHKALLAVPLMREGVPTGVIAICHPEVDGFTDAHVELLKTFAEQAVIAMGSVATFRELQDRTAELTRSVAELQALEEVLRAVNSSLDLDTVLTTIIDRAVPLAHADEGLIYEFDAAEQVFVPKAAFGMTDDRVTALRERRIRLGETYLGRSAADRAPVAIADVQEEVSTPEARTLLQGIHAVLAVPLLREDAVVGGLVIRRRTEGAFAPATVALMQTFAAQSVLAIENARLFEAARHAQAASDAALADLRRAQNRLVQTEKMASLGQLTAGIAHEIKNPLNFVNNFSALSAELVDELQEALAPAPLEKTIRTEVNDLTALLKSNLEKVVQHGKRADSIVKNMLLHSRESGGDRRSVDLNAIVEEALNLAYHGARAEKPGFDICLVRQYDPAAGDVELFPQEFTRVLLNLFSNGFYAATHAGNPGVEPTLTVTTEARPGEVAIRVRDNGAGIPDLVKQRIFEPFYTTKPAGEGTGLGLSLSHDIVVKQHGGTIGVDSCVGEYSEFSVILPRG